MPCVVYTVKERRTLHRSFELPLGIFLNILLKRAHGSMTCIYIAQLLGKILDEYTICQVSKTGLFGIKLKIRKAEFQFRNSV